MVSPSGVQYPGNVVPSYGRSVEANILRPRARAQLTMARDQLWSCRTGAVHEQRADAEVVDPLQDENVSHARLPENIAIEARERINAGAVRQHAVAVDAEIEDAKTGARGVQT